MDVESVGPEGVCFFVPTGQGDRTPGHDGRRTLHQYFQQCQLRGGQTRLDRTDADLPGDRVDRQVAHFDHQRLHGFAPALQGHGLGSRLLAAANARLDAEGLPAYLETGTTRNVALYRRHGYEVISEHKARKDAPNMWSMWREPGSMISI